MGDSTSETSRGDTAVGRSNATIRPSSANQTAAINYQALANQQQQQHSSTRPNASQNRQHHPQDNTQSQQNSHQYNQESHQSTHNSFQQQHQLIAIVMKRLKRMGWYWGSISPEYASRLLDDQEDGSFLVRDSSSECHIFSMTIKAEGRIHHARIEHSKGQFSFGGRTNPKLVSHTIVELIEKAIQYSHDGEYSFFLHGEPSVDGPKRVRMLPLSRLKQGTTSSLKHMCRFAILPYVRRDKINELSIPNCLMNYLYEPFH